LNLNQIKIEFDSRHDFDSPDLNILKERYPNILFKSIPDAWIYLIDKFLSNMDISQVISITQEFGFLCVDGILDVYQRRKIKNFEEELYCADIDLYSMFMPSLDLN
jgi:hypothetical protein